MLKPTIGLEIHIELKTNSKMFCSCKNDPDEKQANFNVCPTCTGHPGTLPVANKEAIKKVIKTGLALNCKILSESKFDRKNYFYPDLPKGYQISQYDKPFCQQGKLEIPVSHDFSKFDSKIIRITRIHLEEDTGRLMHPDKVDYSLVDYNRAGIPLMELVTEPDLESGLEVRRFAEELQLILRYLGVSDADMEKGQMRIEVNISLSVSKKLGTKVEIKNLNSFRSAEKSVDYEIKRQTEILKNKEKVIQETRGWDDDRGETFSQRKKEEAHDYRYFPEPDLPPIIIDTQLINSIRAEITELPAIKRKRFKKEYGLDPKSIEVFVDNKDLSEYFEKTASELIVDAKNSDVNNLIRLLANYLITDIQGMLGGRAFVEKEFKITPENLGEFINLVNSGAITSKTAKDILLVMAKTGDDPSDLIKKGGLGQVNDELEIENVIREVIKRNPKPVEDYRSGAKNALQFLAGQVMAATKGRANPELVQKLLSEILRK